MDPVVSIVLPVWNGERYFRQSIESCLNQSFPDLEVIVVDDGSVDSTPSLIEEYAHRDGRLRALSHTGNRGLSQALNTGFASARGNYFTWTSADNYYRPAAIEALLEVLRAAPDAQVVYSDYTVVDADGNMLECRSAGPVQRLLLENCVGGCFLYCRTVQETLGRYDDSFFLAEDYDFWLRASARFRMTPVHQDLYCARDHKDSLSVRFAERVGAVSDKCLEHNLQNLTWASRPQKAAAQVALARRAQSRGEWARSFRLACSAVRLAPLGSLEFMLDSLHPRKRGSV